MHTSLPRLYTCARVREGTLPHRGHSLPVLSLFSLRPPLLLLLLLLLLFLFPLLLRELSLLFFRFLEFPATLIYFFLFPRPWELLEPFLLAPFTDEISHVLFFFLLLSHFILLISVSPCTVFILSFLELAFTFFFILLSTISFLLLFLPLQFRPLLLGYFLIFFLFFIYCRPDLAIFYMHIPSDI